MIRKGFLLVLFSLFATYAFSQEVFSAKSKPIYITVGDVEVSLPVLTWLTPAEDGQVFENTTIEVEIGINSQNGIKVQTLYVNNIPSVDRGLGVVKKDNTAFDNVYKKEIYLQEGENTIKLTVEDEKGGVKTEIKKINVKLPVVADRTDYALVIGSNEYDSWDNLVNPEFDAMTVNDELKNNYGFKTEFLKSPTKAEFLTKLREYAKRSYKENDQLFIFIAGHGQFDEFFGQGYLVMKDSDIADETKMSYVSHNNLRAILSNIPCEHIFLVMDACFAGTIDPTVAQAGSRGAGDGMYGEISQEEYVKRKLQYKTRKFLTSGGKVYVADGIPGQHSPFAAKFIEALRSNGGENGVLTLSGIRDKVEALPMLPRFGDFTGDEPGSDFVFQYRN
jgi:PKD repeat protein